MMARHWLNYAESNAEAARIVLAKAAAGDESVAPLIAWAKRILERAEPPETSPVTPPEQLELGVNS
jgi:hypothetical protein